ncbi:K63-linked polyubiquitin modification-dependent protein binding [Pristimantis euphronides]
MSTNPLFTTKKRDLSVLYGGNRMSDRSYPVVHQSVQSSGNDQGAYPPSKRYCPTSITESAAMEDVFADVDDFTADDLEEIDIIASQAYTQDSGATSIHANHAQGNVTVNSSQTSKFLQPQRPAPLKRGRAALSMYRITEGLHPCTNNETSAIEVLQFQHEDLKQKLKVLQDEIIIKNGEIKVLRDALRQSESSLEQQRIAHVVLEKEKTQVQSEKDKEVLKKIQSLQSELQFKDAEMIELKTKLQSCERRTVLPQLSPKKSPPVTVRLESCPSPQPGKMSFPTKESFRASTSFKPHVPVSPQHVHLPVKSDNDALNTTVKQARVFSTLYCKQSMDRQGSLLLSTLMQQSEPLGLPGLYHLLSSNLGGLPVSTIPTTQSNNTAGTSCSNVTSPSHGAALKDCQKLAISGLNSIALGEDCMEKKGSQRWRETGHLLTTCGLSGALRMLPLVEYHITMYYQALQSLEKSDVGSSENPSMCSTSSSMASAEDTISRFTDPALASLQILYHLVFYSLDVVETLLQSSTAGTTPPTADQESHTAINRELDNELILHPLFHKIVQLLSATVVAYKRDAIRVQVLRVLVKLAENSSDQQLSRFQGLLSSRVLLQCLSLDVPIPMAIKTVRLLALLADDGKLASFLCSCSENCFLLALYTYVISRPDKQASQKLSLQLEHEMVRFLNKLITQGWSSPPARSGATCLCNREVVKALVSHSSSGMASCVGGLTVLLALLQTRISVCLHFLQSRQ